MGCVTERLWYDGPRGVCRCTVGWGVTSWGAYKEVDCKNEEFSNDGFYNIDSNWISITACRLTASSATIDCFSLSTSYADLVYSV
jgi:hypothetical protein